MPWARTDWMSERVKFIAAYLEYEANFSDLCLDFGISRKTGYKWVGMSVWAVAADIVQSIVAIRRRHPRWGPRKVRVVLKRQRARIELPAASTNGDFESRVAYPNGVISFGTTQWYVSACLAGERLGLEPCDDGR